MNHTVIDRFAQRNGTAPSPLAGRQAPETLTPPRAVTRRDAYAHRLKQGTAFWKRWRGSR